MQDINDLTPTRPYMVRAIHQWLEDNQLTPYIMVDVNQPHVSVPMEYAQDGRIVLNISSSATARLEIDNDFIHFYARFSGNERELWVPLSALLGIYAKENGNLGMFFDPSEYENYQISQPETEKRPKRANIAGLKIVD